jgi:hypothetical protein
VQGTDFITKNAHPKVRVRHEVEQTRPVLLSEQVSQPRKHGVGHKVRELEVEHEFLSDLAAAGESTVSKRQHQTLQMKCNKMARHSSKTHEYYAQKLRWCM